MGRVCGLWRHPVKSHGRETLDAVELAAGATMPWDRTWAVAHEAAKADGSAWAPCANFSRGAKAPGLMAIDATLDEPTGKVTFRHPNQPDITLDPDTEGDKLIAWAAPLMPQDHAASAHVVRVPGRGMTDTDFPSISIGNMASHRAVEQRLGRPLSEKRWRINIWLDGLAPWEEFDLVGQEITIGDVRFAVRERIVRCNATKANPETGRIDADTLGALNSWDHQDLGVYAEVLQGGRIALGDGLAPA